MAENSVEEYQLLLKDLLAARNSIEQMSKTISGGASGLRDWKRLHIKNSSVKFPATITTDPTCPTINAEHWPDAEELATALRAWRDALEKAEKIWGQLSDDQKVGFLKPSAY